MYPLRLDKNRLLSILCTRNVWIYSLNCTPKILIKSNVSTNEILLPFNKNSSKFCLRCHYLKLSSVLLFLQFSINVYCGNNVSYTTWHIFYCLFVILAWKIAVVVGVRVKIFQCKSSTAKVIVKKFANNSRWTVEIYSINYHQNQRETRMCVFTHPEIVNRGNIYYSLPGFSVNTLWKHSLHLIIFWIWHASIQQCCSLFPRRLSITLKYQDNWKFLKFLFGKNPSSGKFED